MPKRRCINDGDVQGNKRAKIGDDDNRFDYTLVSDFLNNANEDVLLEIFLRLPNCRSATLAGSVCRQWRSTISHPQFIPRFIALHQDRYSLPYTIIFRRDRFCPALHQDPHYYQPFCKILSEESMVLHGKEAAVSSYFEFMPLPVITRASFDDLLLVSSRKSSCRDFYICNPVTKRYFQLPQPPEGSYNGFALLCMSNCHDQQLGFSTDAQYQYKVALIQKSAPMIDEEDDFVEGHFSVTIFCSKSGQWSISHFISPPPTNMLMDTVITCDGILYFMDGLYDRDRIIALDLFNNWCGAVAFPHDFGSALWKTSVKMHLGVVRGELRLLKFYRTKKRCVIKVWELKDKDYAPTSWFLVHHQINFKPMDTKGLLSFAFHPTNGDVVFLVRDKDVLECNILEVTYKKIEEFQESLTLRHICDGRVVSTTLMHPFWPTPVPSHPPSN